MNSSASSCSTILKRLALDRVSPQFVANCAQAFKTDQDLLDARRELDKITVAAIGKPVEELEADDEVHDSSGIRRRLKKKKGINPWYVIDQHI